jgi:hypothetical protein
MAGNNMKLASDYPYEGLPTACKPNLANMKDSATVQNYVTNYKPGVFIAPSVIKKALFEGGEVAAAVCANNPILRSYKYGIITAAACNN